jgi:hypothetical protein
MSTLAPGSFETGGRGRVGTTVADASGTFVLVAVFVMVAVGGTEVFVFSTVGGTAVVGTGVWVLLGVVGVAVTSRWQNVEFSPDLLNLASPTDQ